MNRTERLIGVLFFNAVCCVVIAVAAGGLSFISRPFGVIFLFLWAAWWTVIAFGRQFGVSSAYDRGQLTLVLLGTVALIGLIVVSPWEYANFTGPIPRDGPLAWAGLLLLGACIVLQAAAMQAISGLYTSRLGIQPDHRLVTSGPYSVVRHPGYLSNLMCMTGIGLALSSLVALGFTAFVIPLIVKRIDREEKMLATEFGESYRAYGQRTRWRLLPLVY